MNQINYASELESRGVDIIHRSGREVMCRCPLPDHDDSSPSFQFNTDSGLWNCFGCGESGNWLQLVMVLDECDFGEARRQFPISTGKGNLGDIRRDPDKYEPPIRYYNLESFWERFVPVIGTPGEEYLAYRGLNRESMERFGVRYAGEGTRDMRGRVIIPILSSEGRLVSFKGRATSRDIQPKDKLARTAKHALFGLSQIRGWVGGKIPFLVLVEGEIDAMYLQQFRVPAVANGGTSKLSDQRVAIIRSHTRSLFLSLDGDGPGQAAQWKIYEQMRGRVRVKTIELPDGRDPNDLTPEEVKQIYQEVVL